jgi:hypothetical protein
MKVVDLRAILQNGNVPFDSKLTKPGLIKKILETPSAVAVASAPEDSAGADDDLVSLPLHVDFDISFSNPKSSPTYHPGRHLRSIQMHVY